MFALTYGESQGSSQMFNQMPQEIINKLKKSVRVLELAAG